jgi:hypothetical protein
MATSAGLTGLLADVVREVPNGTAYREGQRGCGGVTGFRLIVLSVLHVLSGPFPVPLLEQLLRPGGMPGRVL